MTVRMVRAKIKPGKAVELEKAAAEMFAAIEAAQPQGVRYASCKLPDGETYVILLALEDDENNPLAAVPAFREFQESLKGWLAAPPAIERLAPVGSYRLF
jgi:quinol monooxygenase YgiN